MKNSILLAAMTACTLSAPLASAQDPAAPGKPATPTAVERNIDGRMSRMQEKMQEMPQLMERIRATTDPKERGKLMHQHMQSMQENMQAMRGVGGPMPKTGSQSGMARGGGKSMTGGDMMQHHAMMEKRIDMMQTMMEQMMQHGQATASMHDK